MLKKTHCTKQVILRLLNTMLFENILPEVPYKYYYQNCFRYNSRRVVKVSDSYAVGLGLNFQSYQMKKKETCIKKLHLQPFFLKMKWTTSEVFCVLTFTSPLQQYFQMFGKHIKLYILYTYKSTSLQDRTLQEVEEYFQSQKLFRQQTICDIEIEQIL